MNRYVFSPIKGITLKKRCKGTIPQFSGSGDLKVDKNDTIVGGLVNFYFLKEVFVGIANFMHLWE